MAMNTGTNDISSLLSVANQSVAAFGADRVAAVLAADIGAHNRIVREEFMTSMVEVTDDRQRIAGVSTTGTMMEVDEYGRAPTQKQAAPPSLGFPLKLYQWPIGWTAKWMQTKTPADMAIAQQGAQRAHLRALLREAKKSFFLTTNYTFVDKLVDRVSLSVKRLANADGFAIPNGPNNEVYTASTHQHYLGEATLSAAGVQSLIDTVLEHDAGGAVLELAISATNETAFRALTGFVAAMDPRLVLSTSSNQASDRLDIRRPGDRRIGYFGAAEVWVRPWAIASYTVAYFQNATVKPLVMRQRAEGGLQGLRIAAEIDAYPLHAQYQEAEFGFAVQNRVGMAVLYSANATYADPTIT